MFLNFTTLNLLTRKQPGHISLDMYVKRSIRVGKEAVGENGHSSRRGHKARIVHRLLRNKGSQVTCNQHAIARILNTYTLKRLMKGILRQCQK